MTEQEYDIDALLDRVKSRRGKIVLRHIHSYGFITSQDLKDIYGYNHPPRAVRDVKDFGVPLETFKVSGKDGKMIAAYKLGDLRQMGTAVSKIDGRTALSKDLKAQLIKKYGAKCFIYQEEMDESHLQIDHRIPFEIAGEQNQHELFNFMLLSPSANRSKSWNCEHCENWQEKNPDMCKECFWAFPEHYTHVAGKEVRVVQLMFTGEELADYRRLVEEAGDGNLQGVVKRMIHHHFCNK